MLTGWRQIGGAWYYLTGSGAMATEYLDRGLLCGWFRSLGGWKSKITGWLDQVRKPLVVSSCRWWLHEKWMGVH
ncbi:MAG: hypothetical protein ACLTX3_08235 [Lachnospiraceae bacterium]